MAKAKITTIVNHATIALTPTRGRSVNAKVVAKVSYYVELTFDVAVSGGAPLNACSPAPRETMHGWLGWYRADPILITWKRVLREKLNNNKHYKNI